MYVHWFDEALPDRTHFGGKGASLATLFQAGLPVPDGFCISKEAYEHFAGAARVQEVLGAVGECPPRDPAAAKRLSEEVLARLAVTPLPCRLEAEVAEACERLMESRLAVRSSATSEDGRGASFAGMYESYLNLEAGRGLLGAVSLCYASLWKPHAIQYRAVRGVDHACESMAVVVMEMVPAAVAGVAFSVNPLTGCGGEVVINASWGLGESVVGGRVSPDQFIARKADGSVLQRVVARKEQEIVGDEEGVCHRAVDGERASKPCLSDADVREIVDLVRAIEDLYGTPQDVEFARGDGGWQIVQSRPITTSAGRPVAQSERPAERSLAAAH